MISDYRFLMYVNSNSKIHKMNSKYKILWFLISVLLSLIIIDYISYTLFFVFIYYLMYKSNVKLTVYLYNIKVVWPMYILLFLISYLLTFNLIMSALIVLKFILFVMLLSIVTSTTSLSEIAWGFECLFQKLKKIKVPVSKLSLKIAMLIKFLSTLVEQKKMIKKSMAYRGMSFNGNKIKEFMTLFVPVINLSYKLSKRTTKAMRLRFYGNSKKRTNYHDNKVSKFDKILIFINIIFIYISISLGWIK